MQLTKLDASEALAVGVALHLVRGWKQLRTWCVWRWPRVVLGSFFLYLLYYRLRMVRRPRLTYAKNDTTQRIIVECPHLRKSYWPLFLFSGAYAQLFWNVLMTLWRRTMQDRMIRKQKKKQQQEQGEQERQKKSKQTTTTTTELSRFDEVELIALKDGQKIPLFWGFPEGFKPSEKKQTVNADCTIPIVLLLYGVAGSEHDFSLQQACQAMKRNKWITVVLGRRGHHKSHAPLTVPNMGVLASQYDTHQGVCHVHDRFPKSPLIFLGFSAGTAYMVRYMGDLAVSVQESSRLNLLKGINDKESLEKSNSMLSLRRQVCCTILPHQPYERAEEINNAIVCGVLVSPGYDTSICFERIAYPFDRWMLTILKRHYLDRNRDILEQHNPKGFAALKQARTLGRFLRLYARHFSGYESYEAYLTSSNPVVNCGHITKPFLAINSRDDPICTASNIDDFRDLFTENHIAPNAMLVETRYGSHCCFYDFLGKDWAMEVSAEFIRAALKLLK